MLAAALAPSEWPTSTIEPNRPLLQPSMASAASESENAWLAIVTSMFRRCNSSFS